MVQRVINPLARWRVPLRYERASRHSFIFKVLRDCLCICLKGTSYLCNTKLQQEMRKTCMIVAMTEATSQMLGDKSMNIPGKGEWQDMDSKQCLYQSPVVASQVP